MEPIVRDMVQSNKDGPPLARQDVLLEYVEKYNAKLLQQFRAMDERSAALIQVLAAKGMISEKDFGTEGDKS